MKAHLLRHLQVLLASLGQLARAPLPALMTMLVLGIALALPATLYTLVGNLSQVALGWQGRPQITVFLSSTITGSARLKLQRRMVADPLVDRLDYISPQAAAAELRKQSEFGQALDLLVDNPLPPALVLYPVSSATGAALATLAQTLKLLPGVDRVHINLQWLARLHSIVALVQRGVAVLAVLLALGVALVISNTIRLAILSRREEIAIIHQIGATRAFIRRPFLYTGMLQGLFGAMTAWLIVALVLDLLSAPVAQLATLYDTHFQLRGLGLKWSLLMLAGATGIGWLAARFTVNRHLAALYV